MKRVLKKLFLGVLVLAVIFFIAVASIGRKPFNRFVEQQIISIANSQGVRLALKETDVGLRSLSAKSGEIFLPRAFFLLPFEKLTVSPHWISMLLGELGVSFEATLAQGAGRFRIVRTSEDTVTINSDLSDAQISELSQFSAFGFTDGTLAIKTTDLKIVQGQPSQGELSLSFAGMEKPLASQIKIMLGNFPIPVQIPPVHKGSVNAQVALNSGTMDINSLESLSSWGTVSAKGDITFDSSNQVSNLHVKGEVHLSEDGHASFRSFLPLMSQGILKLETTSFTFEVSGKPPAVKTRFFDLG